jgi:alpha-galactosidase
MKTNRQFAASFLVIFSLGFGASHISAVPKDSAAAAVAQAPAMGWNSWNKFGCSVSDKLIRETADAMVSTGLQAAGYKYVNIDDCWQVSRDANGVIVVDAQRFPNGIKPLADYVHSKGLKLGIYTDAGRLTCEKRPGSYQHELQDIQTYAAWGIDYVKIDWCAAEGLDPIVQYAKFRDAIAQAGRPIYFSICNWGVKAPWRWGRATGNSWRTTGDISDKWESMSLIGFSQNGLETFAGPGHWNDPDMLEVGNGGMTRDEYRTHMALWAILAAPLLAGNDLRNMPQETKEMLTNADVIAVDQDAKGMQGHRVWEEGTLEIWVRPLSDGGLAVGLFNRTEEAFPMKVEFKSIGAPTSAKVRDLWEQKDLGVLKDSFSAVVPKHGVIFIKISK